jgi:hypothetical protein
MYLSYSGYSSWDKCPFLYWHRYAAKTQLPEPTNRVNMIFGAVVGTVFEQFYNEKLWRKPDFVEDMVSRVPKIAETTIASETAEGKNGIVNWADSKSNYPSLEAVITDAQDAVRRGIKSIRHHRLVGPDAAAEVKLDSKIGGNLLAGRADFIMRRVAPHGDRIILDGKGSKFREEYVDKRQLRWYSMLYEHQNKVLPDKAGFLYWRSEPEAAIDWVEVTAEDTAILRQTVTETIEDIESRRRELPVTPIPTREKILSVFPAQPSVDCRWCDYITVCEAGKQHMKNRGKAPKPISDGGPDGAGVEDVGLG